MPRPSLSTPIDRTIETARAVATWHDTYDDVAKAAHGPSWDGKAQCLSVATQLESTDALLARELRDDIDGTRLRGEAITTTQRFLRATLASAQLAFEGDSALDAILRDFAAEAPSRVRSVGAARKAVNRAIKAIETHQTRLDATVARSARHLEDARKVLDLLNAAGARDAREVIETRQATRAREEALAAALRLITLTQLAAEAMEVDQPEALADLFKLFDSTNPVPTSRSTGDDLLGGGLRDADIVEPAGGDTPA